MSVVGGRIVGESVLGLMGGGGGGMSERGLGGEQRGRDGYDCGSRGSVMLGCDEECILGGRWDGGIGQLDRFKAGWVSTTGVAVKALDDKLEEPENMLVAR